MCLEDCLDQFGEDLVEDAEVDTRDHHEEDDDPGELGERPAIRPLDALELGPARPEEPENLTAAAARPDGPPVAAHATRLAHRAGRLELVLEDLALVGERPRLDGVRLELGI